MMPIIGRTFIAMPIGIAKSIEMMQVSDANWHYMQRRS